MKPTTRYATGVAYRSGRRRPAQLLAASVTAVMLVAALTGAGPAAAEVRGEPLDFRASATTGEPVTTEGLAGRWVLLDFWGTWCVPCIAAFPKLQQLQDEHPETLSVVGLAFFSGTGDAVAAFAAQHEVRYTIWMGDEALIAKFGVIAFPSYFLIDPEGQVVLEIVGESGDLYGEVSALLPAEPTPTAP